MISIQQLSKEVAIGTDTLRIWERRYGFPTPLRDSRGHRLYPENQVEELRIVKKLQNLGYRPNRIFAMNPGERNDLLKNELDQENQENTALHTLARDMTAADIDLELRNQLERIGLDDFVHQLAVPLLSVLDQGWTNGTISIAREHLISDLLEKLLKSQLSGIKSVGEKPRMLFLTLSGERHKLGLLLAAALFQSSGLDCLLLNEELPLTEIPQLAIDLEVSGVALSFSAHYPTRQAKKDLASLRNNLDHKIKIFAGGQSIQGGLSIQNLVVCTELVQIPALCKKFFNKKRGPGNNN